jgi:MFS family permease
MSPTSDTEGRAGYLELVRGNADFRNLWYGQITSLFGDWFNLIASASLVGKLTGSGLAVGSLFAVRMLAPFLISPVAGVAADRYNRKKLLILNDIIRAVVVLGFLFVRTPQQVWLLYALTAIQLAMTGVFFPTRNAILPEVVSRLELGAANALSSATWSVMLAFGAAMGGLVAGGWGIYPAFVIDALTFLVSAFFLARIHYRPQGSAEEKRASLRDSLRQYVDGLGYLKRHPDILAIALHKAALCFFVAGAYDVIQVAVSTGVFVIGEGGGVSLGLMYAVVGVGSGIGPILARHFTGDRDRPLRIALIVAYFFMATGLVVASTLANFGVFLLGTTIRAFGGGMLWVFSTQLLLHLVPNEVRGRVFSTEFALMTLAMAVSTASGGWVLDQTSIGIAGLLRTLTGIALIPGLLWSLWLVFGLPAGPPADGSRSEQPARQS